MDEISTAELRQDYAFHITGMKKRIALFLVHKLNNDIQIQESLRVTY